jgi:poly-D-alanine transfer protein DltD
MERRVALRVSGDEEVEVHLHADPRQVSLEDLGLAEEDLAEMDQRQNTADSFQFDNKVWLYRLSRETQVFRDDQAQPTGYYYWEFQEQDGKGLIAIRKPEGEPFAVTRYDGIPAGDVTIYRPAAR